ncbi:hypothetical protein RUM44_013353 [Polyplax serrata]|uniref:Guanine nucleotide-releasing factor 2 n=1 Tax=Polyplax serrata TaxID=468196 RepID=A0ABR1BDX8_POLSC
MRSSGGSTTRSASPCSPKPRTKAADIVDGTSDKNPSKDLECNIRQAQLALKHFRDVVNKNKLEMLPGNGTVVLETVTAIHVLLKKYVLNEQSSILVSATNQVYQSVAKLIKLCDDYLLIGEKALGKENVTEIVNLVEDAIHNLVSLTRDKITVRDSNHKAGVDVSTNHIKHKPRALTENNTLDGSQRNSLPDIPLTPREREILERTSAFVLERHSQSSENVLDDSPPPKPPHPDRVLLDPSFPPPLPPKKRQKNSEELAVMKNSMECLSLRSKSPEDSSSLSASAGSLDSVMNHCREETNGSVLADVQDGRNDHLLSSSVIADRSLSNGCSQNFLWDYSSSSSSDFLPCDLLNTARDFLSFVPEVVPSDNSPHKLDRLSGSHTESGFVSLPSARSSFQSYSTSSQHLNSTRSSQQSYTSQESHHTEKQVISSSESSCQKFQTSFVVENSHHSQSSAQRIVTTTSSERLSYQKQSVTKHSTEMSSSGDFWTRNDSSCNLSVSLDDSKPPALPEKTRTRTLRERHLLHCDNFSEKGSILETSQLTEKNCSLSQTVIEDGAVEHKQSNFSSVNAVRIDNTDGVTNISQADAFEGTVVDTKTVGGVTEQSVVSVGACSESTSIQTSDGKPPPLPPKKKHIMAYMEIFGNASHANENEFLRHSVHAYNILQSEWQQHQKLLTSAQSCSFTIGHSNQSTPVRTIESKFEKSNLPPALPPKKRTRSSTSSPPQTPTQLPELDSIKGSELTENHKVEEIAESSELLVPEPLPEPQETSPTVGEKDSETFLLDRLTVSDHLLLKKPEDEGPDIRGGHHDALVIHATKAHRNDFLYQEAFLTTYRTFMTPLELIQKLCYRHEKFSNSQDVVKQRAARESFSLLVRVVSDLTLTDLEQVVLQTLMEFVQQLLCRGDLTMAKALRVIMLSKYEAKKLYLNANTLLPSHNIYTRQSLLLDFKSEQIAEQMTLLDAELFLKIEIPEVLIWAQEQNEEKSPNLTKFTEHFNKMSYWARSRILEQNDAKDREKYVVKFIKIMKHLRKINNFNSYLALLSALDSAPVRRLEWQKHITEGLKEYCALIDSSSSFRAYRQALAETHPPCIPYIGLVLQDLTFVHIGNTNNLPTGEVNFSKRWQQFNIVENMKRFKKGGYPYKKNERIIAFFNGFDDSLSEEAMWQISEKIKPRGGKKM